MNWIEILSFLTEYLLPFMGLPLLGVIIGAWLTNSFFPFHLKRREWRWEKEVWAKELFFETVSQIKFISDHYIKGEYEEKFSMSNLGLHETDDEIKRLIKKLHSTGHQLKLYLNKKDLMLFEQYIIASQTEYDTTRAGWGEWHNDDDMAKIQYIEDSIARQGQAAAHIVEKFRASV
jgi:hypothetical protein